MEKSNCNKDIYKEHRLTVPCHQGKQFQDKKNLRNIIHQDTTRTNRNQTELPRQRVGRQTAAKQITPMDFLHRQKHLEKQNPDKKCLGKCRQMV